MPTCRSCNAEIVWAKTGNGRAMPLDAEPVPDGNLAINDEGGVVSVLKDRLYQGPRYKSHFATCPHAKGHRRAR